ncbi:MAG: putative membrane protein YeiH [Gammaproteobacteria bacterium]|jgi:uncharacterized membrane protein YeiH
MEPMLDINPLIVFLTVLATAVMAVTGVIQAVRSEFDPFGAMVLAFISAVGGGTVRDLLLGASPVFWVTDLIYITTVVPVVLVALFFAHKMKSGGGKRMRWLSYIDAIGLALFSVLGVLKALEYGVHPVIAVMLGCVTGVFGGILRDVFCGEKPIVLQQDLYATIAILGGGLLVLLNQLLSIEASSLIAFIFIIVGRAYAIKAQLSLSSL